MKISTSLAIIVALTVLFASCLPGEQVPGIGPEFNSILSVETGYTYGDPVMGESSTFTLSWTAAEGAEWYDIRISPHPISESNWNTTVRIDSISAESNTDVVVLVEVQPAVFSNTCISCGSCVEACPQSAMSLVDGNAVIDLDRCTACGQCVSVCPVNAVTDSRFGQGYYFAVRAMGSGNSPSEIISTSESYRLRYTNNEDWCGECGDECFILQEEYGPGCPVDAIYYIDDDDDDRGSRDDDGLILIDYDLCINCGQCFIQCREYGLWSIMKEVVAE